MLCAALLCLGVMRRAVLSSVMQCRALLCCAMLCLAISIHVDLSAVVHAKCRANVNANVDVCGVLRCTLLCCVVLCFAILGCAAAK